MGGNVDWTEVAIILTAIVPSIILHEVAHGVVALWFGDDTAKRAGRLTLNPIKHVDPFGTVILPLLLSLGHLQDSLADVDRALAKLEDGTYGKCEVCGEDIAEARLEALPASRYCINHA